MKHLILGNGPAGVIAAETLRKSDAQCEITMVGSENEPPYSRMAIPYLLENNIDEAGTYLRKDDNHYADHRITNKVAMAKSVDTQAKTVQLDDGSTESYDKLLIATGSHPIRPPIPVSIYPMYTRAGHCRMHARSQSAPSRVRTSCKSVQDSSAVLSWKHWLNEV